MNKQIISLQPGESWLIDDYIDQTTADQWFQTLYKQVEWRQDSIQLFGREVLIPRLQAYMADPGIDYRYSNLTLKASPLHPIVKQLQQSLRDQYEIQFNAVLLNLYRDGNDSMGWHSDDEPELGRNPVIACISLGAERDFLFRRKHKLKGEKSSKLNLTSGSLLWMSGSLQHHWQHSIPKRTHCQHPRISLTFRQIDTY